MYMLRLYSAQDQINDNFFDKSLFGTLDPMKCLNEYANNTHAVTLNESIRTLYN